MNLYRSPDGSFISDHLGIYFLGTYTFIQNRFSLHPLRARHCSRARGGGGGADTAENRTDVNLPSLESLSRGHLKAV